MAGIKAGRFIQLGQEVNVGTEVDATTTWRGMGTIEDNTETVFAEEDVGYLSGVDRTYIPSVGATLEMEETEATFEQMLHILQAGIDTIAGAADGAGSGYIYAYVFPELATDTMTVKTYTIEGGDNEQEEQFVYGFVESFSLSGAPNEAVKVSAVWKGQQVAAGTKTTIAGALPTVEEILFNRGKLYIGTGDTFGTQKTNTWLGFTLDVTTGWKAVQTGDGNLYFSFLKNIGPEITCEFTFEHDTVAVTEIAAWRAGTHRKIRMEFTGTTFDTAGTAYTNKTLLVDLDGKWESFDPLDDDDGNDVVTGTFRARYNSTSQAFASITDVVNLAAIP